MNAQTVQKLLDSHCEDDVHLGIQYLYKLTPEEIETFWKFRNRHSYTTKCKPHNLEMFILHGYLFVFHGFIQNWGKWGDHRHDSFEGFTDLTYNI